MAGRRLGARTARPLAAALSGLLLLAGCGLVGDSAPVFSMQWVSLASEPASNRNNPTPVDLVLVYDPAASDQLAGLTAADWFRRKPQVLRDFPRGVKVIGWEVVPDQVIAPRELEDEDLENADGDAPRAAFVYADFFTPGDHRARLEAQRAVRIRLGSDDFTLESFDPPN
ncbi:MAG: hypothetical protein NXI21_14145 [Alphaproteobacteria bacterium]|nr:hypothetical protein [Alphaproteobacteria bacterium]